VRDLLGAFLFSGEEVDKKVSVLSGGERSRLALLQLLIRPVNFLILDEPTNHLDMRTKNILKEALRSFEGTLLVVSHDRDFLDGLVETLYEVRGHKLTQHDGDIYRFLEKKKLESLTELERKGSAGGSARRPQETEGAAGDQTLSYEERKRLRNRIRNLKNRIGRLEEEIHALERRLRQMEEMMAMPEKYEGDLNALGQEYGTLKNLLEKKEEEWSRLVEELEDKTIPKNT
jgi:ATP-binding cassette subfamily F protein 3